MCKLCSGHLPLLVAIVPVGTFTADYYRIAHIQCQAMWFVLYEIVYG